MSKTIITTDTDPGHQTEHANVHNLSVHVNNQPGVLMRISQVFARRGYNIDSLVVSRGRNPKFSRMTIGISGDPAGLDQIILQVDKLVDVIHCQEHRGEDTVVRELALIKVGAGSGTRSEALQITEHFGGKTVDLSENSMIIMIQGGSEKIDAAMRLLGKFEIIETIRTGKVAIARGDAET